MEKGTRVWKQELEAETLGHVGQRNRERKRFPSKREGF